MPLSHVEIEEEKRWKISLLFFILIGLYFLSAWLIGSSVKHLLFYYTTSTFYPFLTLKETFIVLVLALAIGCLHWYLSTKDATSKILKILNAHPIDPKDTYHKRLENIVEEVRVATGGKGVRCMIIPSTSVNAFSIMDFDSMPVIGVTEGLLSKLNRRQLTSVIGHEIAHIVSGDCLLSTLGSSLFDIYREILIGMDELAEESGGKDGGGLYVLLFLIYLLSCLMRMAISRQKEYRADAIAVRLTRDPLSLAEALYIISRSWRGGGDRGGNLSPIFIVNPISSSIDDGEGFLNDLFSTHPPVKKRLKILLDMAHTDLKGLEEEVRKERLKGEAIVSLSSPKETSWFVADSDGRWLGPLGLSDISNLGWLRPSTWVKREGEDKPVFAYEDVSLMKLFKDQIEPKLSSIPPCPTCKIPLSEVLYEGVPIWHCRYCQGFLVEESKINRVLSREIQEFSEEVVRYGLNLLEQRKRRLLKKEDIAPKFHLRCPLCSKKMQRRFYTLAYFIEVDICNYCHIIWFDKNELEVLQYLIEREFQKEDPSSLPMGTTPEGGIC